MRLNELSPAEGSKHRKKRVGRGESSGWGKTAGKGSNGQKARTGGGVRPGFEGGQMPLIIRAPKRGFSNARFKTVFTVLNVSDLEVYFEVGEEVTIDSLYEKGAIKKVLNGGVKILADGEITKSLTVKVQKVSEQAKAKIEAVGGKVEIL
ncbi:MAG: 50S ribosomal protein L15 [Fusobacteria bacterium]|nr:50S ribosomal protein L15 [Fusobacteriota bacterium]